MWNKCGAAHEARLRQASADAYLFHVGNTGDSLSKNLLPPGILQILLKNRRKRMKDMESIHAFESQNEAGRNIAPVSWTELPGSENVRYCLTMDRTLHFGKINPESEAMICCPLSDSLKSSLSFGRSTSNQQETIDTIRRVAADDVIKISESGAARMFYNLENLVSAELKNFDFSASTSMAFMFCGCEALETVDAEFWNTALVEDMGYMFSDCISLRTLPIKNWDTSSVRSFCGMFDKCVSLQNLEVDAWETGNVTNMKYMFNGCKSLQRLNLNHWNTANVRKMRMMFGNCVSLRELRLSSWDTSNVSTMWNMFLNCGSLKELDLTGWNTARAENMYGLFEGCRALEILTIGRNFNFCESTENIWKEESNDEKDCEYSEMGVFGSS